ncbi:hypothetical protein FISHEDRAFT_63034 [Fistulina hepatica ATCC 64428]|uniref:Uncharacterized protein n=1 Tax=Fistulina hepatica ATCC 64428 TaxID=1128425 RepID=A0A0D6ZYW9_9AGAR|nr:hypothetical protein FISHEDRAFT_63034 [Fistulina hepatica ATCC 64428]
MFFHHMIVFLVTVLAVTTTALPYGIQDLYARGNTWGTKNYRCNIDHYHRNVKPLLISTFKAEFPKSFEKRCGKNPDFIVERDGTVYPEATGGQRNCPKASF